MDSLHCKLSSPCPWVGSCFRLEWNCIILNIDSFGTPPTKKKIAAQEPQAPVDNVQEIAIVAIAHF